MMTTLILGVFGNLLLFNLVFSSFLSSGNPKNEEKYPITNSGNHQDDIKDKLEIKLDILLKSDREDKRSSRRKRQTTGNSVILCDFEPNSSQCDMRAYTNDTNWVLHSGRTVTANTGVSAAQQGTGYLYMPAVFAREGYIARVFIPVRETGDICLSFWYSMYGTGMGTLEIRQFESDSRQPVVWAKSGNQGAGWKKAELNLRINTNPTYLFWTGVRGRTAQSDMTLDYISATKGRCGGASCSPVGCRWGDWTNFPTCTSTATPAIFLRQRSVVAQPQCGGADCLGSSFQRFNCCQTIACDRRPWTTWSTCSGSTRSRQREETPCTKNSCSSERQTQPCSDLFKCDFESDGCGVLASDSQWNVGNGADQRNGPTAGAGGSIRFLYPLGNFPGQLRRTTTPPIDYTGTVRLSFAYFRYGSGIGSLVIFVETDTHYIWKAIDSSPASNTWISASLQFDMQTGNQIGWMFSAENADYALALDNIVVTPVAAG